MPNVLNYEHFYTLEHCFDVSPSFEESYESLSYEDQVIASINMLRDASEDGSLYLLENYLSFSILQDFFEGNDDLFKWEICAAVSSALKNRHIHIVDFLLRNFSEFRNEILVECVANVFQISKTKNTKELKWLKKQVSTQILNDIWPLAVECDKENSIRWFSLARVM